MRFANTTIPADPFMSSPPMDRCKITIDYRDKRCLVHLSYSWFWFKTAEVFARDVMNQYGRFLQQEDS